MNKIQNNIISFPNSIPKEFDIIDYIDYDMQFDKSFVEPIKSVFEAIGWEVEKRQTLEDFFG